LTYDPNGNILTLQRSGNNDTQTAEDHDFSYQYQPGTNQLTQVTQSGGAAYATYQYDAIGQMTGKEDQLTNDRFTYDVTGKVDVVSEALSGRRRARYVYDDRGFRTSSLQYGYDVDGNSTGNTETVYIRDASGQIMAIYQGSESIQLKELPVYGTERLGIHQVDETGVTTDTKYELKDHLGSVRSVVSRSRFESFDNRVSFYADYYPFGLKLNYSSLPGANYRFGYQGDFAEQDPETGLNYFELRNYDPSVGRFLTIDPAEYVGSPYSGMGNNPIRNIDIRGDTARYYDTNGALLFETFGDQPDHIVLIEPEKLNSFYWQLAEMEVSAPTFVENRLGDFFHEGSEEIIQYSWGEFHMNQNILESYLDLNFARHTVTQSFVDGAFGGNPREWVKQMSDYHYNEADFRALRQFARILNMRWTELTEKKGKNNYSQSISR